jgi:uncharacterized RDD family membrane protein YckC
VHQLEGLMNRQTEVQRSGRLAAAIVGGALIGFGILAAMVDVSQNNQSLFALALGYALAIVIVALTRSNPLLQGARLRVVTDKGARPSVWRHALRMTLLLTPFLALMFALKWHLPFLPIVLGLLTLTGFIWIMVCPERGLHDRLARTWVVVSE